MMENWSVRTRLAAAFTLVILVIAGLSAYTLDRLGAIRKQATDVTTDSMPGLILITELDALVRESGALALMRNPAMAAADLKQIDAQIDSDRQREDELLRQFEPTVLEIEERPLFEALKRDLPLVATADRARRDAAVSAPGAGSNSDALRQQLLAAQQRASADAAAEVDYNRRSLQKDGREVLDEVQSSRSALILGLVVAIGISLVSAFFLARTIVTPLSAMVSSMEVMRTGDLSARLDLRRGDEFGSLADGFNRLADDLTTLIGDIQRTGIQINTSATEIAATSREHQATANEIAATTSEIGATSREISATSKELSRTMNGVTAVAEKTASLATSGQASLNRMEETIQQITAAAGSISAKLTVLNEKASNIGLVVTTINKVADQTNLLSLNAAIEAEKAGEYGRGFAVVATEIRRLADQTAVSTHDIDQMVRQMQSAVSAGVMGMEKFTDEVRQAVIVVAQVSDELSQIIEQVQTLTPNFESVNEGMEAQSVAARQISDALGQLSEAAQQTVDSLRQSNEAIEQLGGATRNLQDGVSRFTLQA
jgi:methyl-accepting chemotaxis protein WspA